jgi:hypothetical protein
MLQLSQRYLILRSELERKARRHAQFYICEAVRKMKEIARPHSLTLQRGLTALLIVQLLIVMAMAVSPQLHKWVHHHADADDHECAVTLFMYGEYDTPAVVSVVPILVEWIFKQLMLPRMVWVDGLFLSRRVLEHAPPAPLRIS